MQVDQYVKTSCPSKSKLIITTTVSGQRSGNKDKKE